MSTPNTASVFKSDAISVELGDKKYPLRYDLNAFCELEKIYSSVDVILQLILGGKIHPDLENITYCGAKASAEEIMVDGVSLKDYIIAKTNKQATAQDTRNLLWAGVIHDFCTYDKSGEINGYTITKAELSRHVTLQNIKQINSLIVTCILRDLVAPSTGGAKNENAEQGPTESLGIGQNSTTSGQ